jgi:hypothetical protein
VAPINQEFTRPLRGKGDQEVIADITITPKRVPISDHTVPQVHPLSGSIGGLGWMS